MFDLLEIRTLGPLHIQWRSAAKPLTLPPREALLLIYLAYQQLPLSRHALCNLLWPDEPRARAQGNLRKLLIDSRRMLGPLLVADRHVVALQESNHSIWLDVHKFKWHMTGVTAEHRPQATAEVDVPRLLEGVKLYRGDFLNDVRPPRSYLLSAWVEREQESLRQQMVLALRTLVTYFIGREQYRQATHYAAQLLQFNPVDGVMVGELMKLHAQMGERDQAMSLFRTYRQALRRLENRGPDAALEQIYQEVRTGTISPLNSASTPLVAAPTLTVQPPVIETPPLAIRTGLRTPAPQTLTPLLHRAEWLTRLQATSQDPTVRLISMVGLGGIGKSHLALTFGHQLVAQGLMDVAIVMLEHSPTIQVTGSVPVRADPLAEPSSSAPTSNQRLLRAMAEVFNHSVTLNSAPLNEVTIDHLLPHLHQHNLLLILDHFDPFMDAVDLVGMLLQHAPQLKILVTARQPLQIPGEVVLRLSGLETTYLAPFAPLRPSSELLPSAAATLFLACLKRQGIMVSLQPELLCQIEQICYQLDGHPLAIELAAGLVPHYHFSEIIELVRGGIDELVAGSGQVRRQQSLVQILNEAWHCLPIAAQQLLQALTIFEGSFSRKAAATIVGASHELLSLLVNHNWLTGKQTGRYQLPQIIRHYLNQQSAAVLDPQQRQALRARHADYYLSHFLDEIGGNSSALQGKVHFVFREDEGNITAAMRWSLQYGDPQRQATCRRLLPLLERTQVTT